MPFSSLEQIQSEFNLHGVDLDSIRQQLTKLRNEKHPKISSTFISKDEEEIYHRIREALDYLDHIESLSKDVALIHKNNGLEPTSAVISSAELKTNLSTQIDKRIDRLQKRYRLPRFGIGGLSLGLGLIWFFPTTLQSNPIVRDFLFDYKEIGFTNEYDWYPSPYVSFIWVVVLSFALFAWFQFERLLTRRINFRESLMLESVQNEVFEEFLEVSGANKGNLFTKDDFATYLSHKPRSFILERAIADSLAEVILNRAKRKDFIAISAARKSLSDLYIVVK